MLGDTLIGDHIVLVLTCETFFGNANFTVIKKLWFCHVKKNMYLVLSCEKIIVASFVSVKDSLNLLYVCKPVFNKLIYASK